MSAISLKSITGITSITTPAGVDNQLTLHTNNTTERVKIDIAGNVHVNNHLAVAGVTTFSSDIDVDGHTNLDNVSVAGVTTMTGALKISSTTDQMLELNSSDNNGTSLAFQRNNARQGYIGYGGGSSGLIIANEVDNGAVAIQGKDGGSAINMLSFDAANKGLATLHGGATIPLDLDVDGHTNLDNVSIAGITTFASNINVTGNIFTTKYIYHTNDTDTYFDFGTNTINLAAGGNIGLTILDSSVRVTDKLGINGASPQTPLDVIANGSGYAINIRGRSSDNIGELRFTSNNYGSLYGTLKGGATYLNFSVDSINSVLRLNSTGLVTMDNGTAQLCMRDSGVVDNAIFYIGGGTRTQTSTTTDFTQICLYDKNSQYNTNTASGSWKSKIKFFAAQMNGGAREGAFVGQDTTYNNFSGSTLKMRSDLIFGTRGDQQTSSSDPATEKLRIRHNGQIQISEPSGTSGDGASLNFFFGNNNSTDVISSIYFSNSVGTVASIKGQTRNGNNYGMITFHNEVNGTDGESMRLNHDGGFCVGTDSTRTAEFTTPDGFSVRSRDSAKGQFQVSVTNETCALLNKKGNNGQIIGFRKDGTGVGEIGVNATTMYLNFGGTTAAAHQLDDYETGTWTCTVYYATGNTTGSHTNTTTITGYFEKIGNLVFIGLNFYPTNYNSGNTAIITKFSLPYNPVQRTAMAFYRYSGAGNYGQMLPQSSQDDAGSYLDTAGHGVVLVGGTNQGSGYWGHHTGQVNAHGHVSGCYRIS